MGFGISPAPTANGVHNLASVVLITSRRDAAREAITCAKASAERWEKIPDINREISSRCDPSGIVDDLIQETASGRLSPARKSERSRAGSLPCTRPSLRLHVE